MSEQIDKTQHQDRMMKWFAFDHLPEKLQRISA
jgi:hypothetical protein